MEIDIIRAWKDARYRQSLTSEQQATLPENPAGTCELTDADLESVQGSWGGAFGSNSMNDCIFSLSPNGMNACNSFDKIAGECVSGRNGNNR